MVHTRRAGTRGFTLSELLLVFTIVLLISLVAYPAMRTFMGANEDASAASRLVRTFNLIKDQAQRRNKAYVIELSLFQRDMPAGRMDVFESSSTSCGSAAENDDDEQLREMSVMPFGGTVIDGYVGPVEDEAGLTGWTLRGDDEQRERLRLCVSGTDGSVSRLLGGAAVPVQGTLEVRVQRFQLDQGGYARVGPPRRVEVSFAGGARMRVN